MERVKVTRPVVLVFLMLFFALLVGCNSAKQPPAQAKGKVVATGAFEKYFGPAPVTDKECSYAFVIYFPSAKEAGKVVPFPFFSFDEPSLKKVALGKLVVGLGDVASYRGELLQPFPAGSRILDVSEAGGNVTVNLSREVAAARPEQQRVLVDAVVLTARQFRGVTGVGIKVEGADTPLGKLAGTADDKTVLPPGPPRLLSVTAVKEKGVADIDEIDAYFDRPLEIKELTLSGADGKRIEGDIFQSVFDMAGVLKMKSRKPLQAGMPIKVHWKVVDKLGRAASGDGDVPLEVKEH